MSYIHTNNGFPPGLEHSDPSLDPMFLCQWIGPDGSYCNYPLFPRELSAHLLEFHGIRGPDNLRVRCFWNNCNKELNKESLSRHVEETHRRIKYTCGACSKTFTRSYNLAKHQNNCPAQQQ
ncbi:hypothetical protein DEU56DRAFT_422851 [Suillus clintonianus]|uniref:uncharacterized protein n=1 Tax=Suillus clintonianus TaxID=1904413 RepID=UPI001B87D5CE|nr:uncharacterized protein DEU56DRAFT_422851 [Suillus clintonianus]KAG2132971.1 hypothetical protein DEU56DRAFT_422851 [Suillus clintonianus]